MFASPKAVGGRPPVEYRLLGMDRRTFTLPLIVVAVFVLWAVVAPAINGSLAYDQPVEPGDAFFIAPDTTMAPPVGWDVQAGVRVRDRTRVDAGNDALALFRGDGVVVSTEAGDFRGDARALNAQVLRNDETLGGDQAFSVKGQLETVTIDGRHGVARRFTTLTGEGAVFTFVDNGGGLSIVVSGHAHALQRDAGKIGRMLASIDFDRGVR